MGSDRWASKEDCWQHICQNWPDVDEITLRVIKKINQITLGGPTILLEKVELDRVYSEQSVASTGKSVFVVVVVVVVVVVGRKRGHDTPSSGFQLAM